MKTEYRVETNDIQDKCEVSTSCVNDTKSLDSRHKNSLKFNRAMSDDNEKSKYTFFLNFVNKTDNEEYKEYKEYNKGRSFSTVGLVVQIFYVLFVILRLYIGGRMVWNPVFAIPTVISLVYFFVVFIAGNTVLTGGEIHHMMTSIYEDKIETLMTLLFTSFSAASIVLKVLAGECGNNDISVFHCNGLAMSKSPPLAPIVFLFFGPILYQFYFKNPRLYILAMNWIIAMTVTLWSFWYIGSWSQIWILFFSILSACVSYEYERMQMSIFLKTKRILQDEQEKRKDMENQHAEKEKMIEKLNEVKIQDEKRKFEFEMKDLEVKNDIKLRAAESLQLRALIGNVAHDLLTPLTSISLDLELLKNKYSDALDKVPKFCKYVMSSEEEDWIQNFECLIASCKFMKMSINRCIDYTKCNSGISLAPTMVTFDLSATLFATARLMISHLHKDYRNRIVLHPVSSLISRNVISDVHWFSENLLCYLSNAVKYSKKTTRVDVIIELISEKSKNIINQQDDSVSNNVFNQQHDSDSNNVIDQQNNSVSNIIINQQNDGDSNNVINQQNDGDSNSIINPQNEGESNNIINQQNDGDSSNIIDLLINTKTIDTCTILADLNPERLLKKTMRSLNMIDHNLQAQQMVQVSVHDQGIGLSKDDRENLFRPFKQAQRMAGGTGLGLYSLSKRLEALGGCCGVDARSDGIEGSVFWFAFPYRPDNIKVATDIDDNRPEEEKLQSEDLSIVNIRSLNILLVDDSPLVLKALTRTLIKNGNHQIEEEPNGNEGLEHMKNSFLSGNVDVVITDLQMPIMDGFTFIKRFRAYEEEMLANETIDKSNLTQRKCSNKNGRLLIIGMSANSDNVSKELALAAGMDKFITKPFKYEDFVKMVRPFLENERVDEVTINSSKKAGTMSTESRVDAYSAAGKSRSSSCVDSTS